MTRHADHGMTTRIPIRSKFGALQLAVDANEELMAGKIVDADKLIKHSDLRCGGRETALMELRPMPSNMVSQELTVGELEGQKLLRCRPLTENRHRLIEIGEIDRDGDGKTAERVDQRQAGIDKCAVKVNVAVSGYLKRHRISGDFAAGFARWEQHTVC